MERITITLTPEMAKTVRGAVLEGKYASSSEIIREALRDWQLKHGIRHQELEALRANVRRGDMEITTGRVRDFDSERIIKTGSKKLAGRAHSG